MDHTCGKSCELLDHVASRSAPWRMARECAATQYHWPLRLTQTSLARPADLRGFPWSVPLATNCAVATNVLPLICIFLSFSMMDAGGGWSAMIRSNRRSSRRAPRSPVSTNLSASTDEGNSISPCSRVEGYWCARCNTCLMPPSLVVAIGPARHCVVKARAKIKATNQGGGFKSAIAYLQWGSRFIALLAVSSTSRKPAQFPYQRSLCAGLSRVPGGPVQSFCLLHRKLINACRVSCRTCGDVRICRSGSKAIG